MIETLVSFTGDLSSLMWGNWITLGALLGTGAYLTMRLGFVQIRLLGHAVAILSGRDGKENDPGELTPFQTLSTSLSATVGTGNIAGVATAVTLGGPGALFWMWVTAMFGMATRFTECSLAIKFRDIGADGVVAGGPMYTIWHGLNLRLLAIAFACFAVIASFGIGNMVQANSVIDGLAFILPEVGKYRVVIGLVMAALIGCVIIGGVKRIAKIASALVPFMAIFYLIAAFITLALNANEIPRAFSQIFEQALGIDAVGGAVVGEAIRWGVARGLFSNEAGLGSSPMVFAAIRTKDPVRGGLVAMIGPFIDTIIICTLTGLVILVTRALDTHPQEVEGAALTAYAFEQGLGSFGAWVVGLGLPLFAFSTILGWSYYGDRAAFFLFGEKGTLPYRLIFTVCVAVGAAIPLKLVWNVADITNLLMAAPNLISLILLASLAQRMLKKYQRDLQEADAGL